MALRYRTDNNHGVVATLLALWLLVLPLRWILGAFAAAMVHECCHVAAVLLLGGRITGFKPGCNGAMITADGLSAPKQLICTLAGPLGALSLLLLSPWIPVIATCALLQSIYNLLPVWPLDGGRAWRSILLMTVAPNRAKKIWRWTERATIAALLTAAVYAGIWLKMGILPFLVAFGVILNKNSLQTQLENSTMRNTIK